MPYNFYNAARQVSSSVKQGMLDGYQAEINEVFANATDIFDIEEENVSGTLVFSTVSVRLNTVVGEAGVKLSDDFRKVIFKDMSHARGLGFKFRFDSSIWLTINYDLFGKPTASTIIRKCRNVLRFIDRSNGSLLVEPCVVENYTVKSALPLQSKSIVVPQGSIVVVVQGNNITRKVTVNQRFILNGMAWKVVNIFNSLDNPTYNDDAPLLYFVIAVDNINPDLDDLVNNIANVNDNLYTLNIKQNNFDQAVGFAGTLNASVFLNGSQVARNVVWSSGSPTIGTIDNAGNIHLLALGSVVYHCSLLDNPLVYDEITVAVVSVIVPVVQTVILPESTSILQGQTVIYTIYKYLDGQHNSDTFTFTASGSPSANYVFTVLSGNSYSIKNVVRSSIALVISATNIVSSEVTVTNYTLGGVF